MVMIETNDPKVAAAEGLKQAGTEVAMHIAATNPLALDKDGIDPEIIFPEVFAFHNVHFLLGDIQPLLGNEDARAAWVGGHLAIVELHV